MRGEGQGKGTGEHRVVSRINWEGLKVEGLKGVSVLCVGGGEKGRKEQRAKIVGWTNGSRVLGFLEILVRRANGKRGMVWELRSEGR